MQYVCHDPLYATCRMADMARRLELVLLRLHVDRHHDGRYLLCLALADNCPDRVELFQRRLDQILGLDLERYDA